MQDKETERLREENKRLRTALEFYSSGEDGLNWNVASIDYVEFPFRQDEHANPIPEPWKIADEALDTDGR